MTTDPKTNNAFRAPSHPEQSTDTNPSNVFEVTVHRTDYHYMVLRIEAPSIADAGRLAETMAEAQEEASWKFADRDISFGDVFQQRGGEQHD